MMAPRFRLRLNRNVLALQLVVACLCMLIGVGCSENAFNYYSRGVAYGSAGNYVQAEEDFTHAIELDPEYAPAYLSRAHARTALGNESGAAADFARAAELDPTLALAEDNEDSIGVIEFPLLPMSESDPLSPRQIFQQVSPAIAFIETPDGGRGSAVFVQPGYLVSNAHVVWPFESVRVVFPDGSEDMEVPVIAWDLVADLAILGPLDEGVASSVEPLTFVDGSQLDTGTTVYLIGYPGEVDAFPQPTITQGILSRLRKWETIDLTLFQVDANVTGGQSGGVLVTERGEIVGISTFVFSSARYAMVSSAADIVPRLTSLTSGDSVSFNERRPLQNVASESHTGTLDGFFETDCYMLQATADTEVDVRVEGVGRPRFEVRTLFGSPVAESQARGERVHRRSFDIKEDDGVYLILVNQLSPYRNEYELTSSEPVVACEDQEDGTELAIGDHFVANVDVPGDRDVYEIRLKKGEKIVVEADSMVLNPSILLIFESGGREQLVQGDNTEPAGVFGGNVKVVYEAPADSKYTLLIGDAWNRSVGGYFVTVRKGEERERVTELSEDRTFYGSPYGAVELYESEVYDFEMKYPARWSPIPCSESATACYQGPQGSLLLIAEEDINDTLLEGSTQEEYSDLIETMMESNLPDAKLVARGQFITPQGYEGDVMVFTGQGGLATVSRFIYLDKSDIAFSATYIVPTEIYEELEDLLDYTFSSFRVWDEANRDEDPLYHLEEGLKRSAEQDYEAALEEYSTAIELDAELEEAYLYRSNVFSMQGDYASAIADLLVLAELDPDEPIYARQLAMVYWLQGDLENALAAADRSIELDPEDGGAYNNRALMRASAGDYAGALEDVAQVEELEEELEPYVLDTRAFIYLSMEDYENAAADYEEVLNQDFKSPYSLLGAGTTFARLGDLDRAVPLIEYAMELLEENPEEHPDPQLATVLAWAEEVLASVSGN